MADRSRCPTCRERVSPFAAGCAQCGTELDIRRHDRVSLSSRVSSAWNAFSVRPDWIAIAVIALFAVGYLTMYR